MLYRIFSVVYFATLSAAAPVSHSLSAITNSGDAWASLVANIAPLLALLGEKHVKAYFKTMSRQSHFMLYAVSPIGLVTAVVTVIRLRGSPLMKRVIGRQFETRAEILADVTSVSYGEVGLQFQGDRQTIEQAISPPPEDEAYFGIYMNRTYTGASLRQDMLDRFDMFGAFDNATRTDSCRIRWYSINVVHVQGQDAQTRSQRLACHKTRIESTKIMSQLAGKPDLQKRQTSDETLDNLFSPLSADPRIAKSQYLDECTFMNATYLEGPGVSPVLTATESLDGSTLSLPNQQNMRYCASLLCATVNVGLIVTDGLSGESKTTLTFVSIGVIGTFLGSLIIANFIRQATTLSYLSMRNYNVECAGFFSAKHPSGIGLAYSPSIIAISTANSAPSNAWASGFTVLLTVLSFISLYLGLRAAAWWLSLSMLADVGITAILRAVLGRAMNIERNYSKKAFQFSTFRRKAALCHMVIAQNSKSLKKETPNNEDDDYVDDKGFTIPCRFANSSNLGKWAVISAAGGAKASPCPYIPPKGNICATDRVIDTLLYNAFNVAYQLHANSFVPQDGHNASQHKGTFIRSEFLGDTTVWRQPLDLLMPFSEKDSNLILDNDGLAELLKSWITEAFVGDHEITAGEPYSLPQCPFEHVKKIPLSPFINEGTFVEGPEILALQQMVRKTARTLLADGNLPATSWTLIWSNKLILWMAIKLIFASRPPSRDPAVFARVLQERRQKLVPLAFPGRSNTDADPSIMDADYLVFHYPNSQGSLHMDMEKLVPWYISCLAKGGLVMVVENNSHQTQHVG